MTKKFTEKYNDSCIKLFEFIKMLYEDKADFKDVINLFSDGNYDGSSNTHVTLNKYLNALKIFGINVIKVNHKYKLLNPLHKIDFDFEDLKSISILKNAEQILPEGSVKQNFDKFINYLEMHLNESPQMITEYSNNFDNNNSKYYHSESIDIIKKYEKFCQDKFKLEIVYNDDNGQELNLICTPQEVLYQKHKIYLKALGNNGSRIYEIPVNNIKSAIQLPSASGSTSIPMTVVYKIKNRLAKNYKIRNWEKLEKIESDGSKIIVNKNEDFDILLRRLMKYGVECELVSPKFLREEMINLINKTLSNYQ